MPPLRRLITLPPQFLLPAWTLSTVGRRSYKTKAKTFTPADARLRTDSKRTLSLIEELFPDEAYVSSLAAKPVEPKKRHLRRLPLPLPLDPKDEDPDDELAPVEADNDEAILKDYQGTEWNIAQLDIVPRYIRTGTVEEQAEQARQLTVIAFRNASQTLSESDFRRTIPKRTFENDWNPEGEILKVIPGRDPPTLNRLRTYYLLFASLTSAKAYKENAERLHKQARKYNPASIMSPLLPPPKHPTSHPDDPDPFLDWHSWTLVPLSDMPAMDILAPPLPRPVQELVDLGGYRRLLVRDERQRTSVMLTVEGLGINHVSTPVIKSSIFKDGRLRGLEWALAGQNGGISPLNSKETLSQESEPPPEDVYVREDYGRGTWVVTLQDEVEARRFVRTWNQREISLER